MKNPETARCAILAGWAIALLGVTCYVIAATQAGAGTDIMDALTGQGVIGWASMALLLGGIAIWLFGNLKFVRRDGDDRHDTEIDNPRA